MGKSTEEEIVAWLEVRKTAYLKESDPRSQAAGKELENAIEGIRSGQPHDYAIGKNRSR